MMCASASIIDDPHLGYYSVIDDLSTLQKELEDLGCVTRYKPSGTLEFWLGAICYGYVTPSSKFNWTPNRGTHEFKFVAETNTSGVIAVFECLRNHLSYWAQLRPEDWG